MEVKRELYRPLLDNGSEEDLETRFLVLKPRSRLFVCLSWSYLAVLHVFFVLVVASALAGWLHIGYTTDFKLWESELPFARDVIEYETVTFAPSGFNDLDGKLASPYEGRRTPENDALWYNLTRVGMYSLTEDEYNKLDLTTIKAVNAPEQRLVTIEVFHQLHCLNYLRRRVYEENGEHFQIESDWSREQHLSHCIDYLRQVLMCHGDLTPITLELAPGKYKPNFSIKHTCRNWDSVYAFAQARNISGTGIE